MSLLNIFRDSFVGGQSNVLDVIIEQNATFDMTLNLTGDDDVTPLTLDGWGITGSIRQTFSGPPITFFTSSIVGVNTGTVLASLSAAQTWELSGSLYHYDIIATDTSATTYRLVSGKIKIDKGVTKP